MQENIHEDFKEVGMVKGQDTRTIYHLNLAVRRSLVTWARAVLAENWGEIPMPLLVRK